MGSSQSKQVLGKTTQQRNVRANRGTIKRATTILAPTLLALGNRQVSIFYQQWERKPWAHSSRTRGTWKLQARLRARASLHAQHQRPSRSWKKELEVSSALRCYWTRNSLFLKYTNQRAPHPLGSKQCCVGLFYQPQHFWFLTQKVIFCTYENEKWVPKALVLIHVWEWIASYTAGFITYQTVFFWRSQ